MKNTNINNELEISLIETIKNVYVTGFILKTIYKENKEDKLIRKLEKVFKRASEIEDRVKSEDLNNNALKIYLKEVTLDYNIIWNAVEREYIIRNLKSAK